MAWLRSLILGLESVIICFVVHGNHHHLLYDTARCTCYLSKASTMYDGWTCQLTAPVAYLAHSPFLLPPHTSLWSSIWSPWPVSFIEGSMRAVSSPFCRNNPLHIFAIRSNFAWWDYALLEVILLGCWWPPPNCTITGHRLTIYSPLDRLWRDALTALVPVPAYLRLGQNKAILLQVRPYTEKTPKHTRDEPWNRGIISDGSKHTFWLMDPSMIWSRSVGRPSA